MLLKCFIASLLRGLSKALYETNCMFLIGSDANAYLIT